jgi:myo-inositol-1(or 4)-monophosphatase
VDIKLLQNLGKKISKELQSLKTDPSAKSAIGVGAAGDKTYPIDKKSEDIAVSELESCGESLTIISEELGIREIKGGGDKVLIDPIDGSKNAVAGIPFYCISIAIADGNTIGDIYMSYILNLASGDEFWATKESGAFLNAKRMRAQEDSNLSLVAFETGVPKRDISRIMPLLLQAFKPRCFGSTALDLAYLANGSISVFVNPQLSRSFDFGGGWLLVKEAGGIFTDILGNSIEQKEISLGKSTSLLASGNRKLHEEALKLLNS